MKRGLAYLCLLFGVNFAYSQRPPSSNFLRLYADNDALIPSDKATDWGYTSGIRIDVFHSSPTLYGAFQGINVSDRHDRVNTSGWGIMQMIYAPKRTSLAIPDRSDYPYSSALTVNHTFHSSFLKKKYIISSECIVGLMGPPSLGKQTHIFFHTLINDPKPKGWDYQLPTDLLLNFNWRAEKLLIGNRKLMLLGSGEIRCGTMSDGISPGLRLRFGNSDQYFEGMTNQFFSMKNPQVSFSITANGDLIFYNALLQGGLFNSRSPVHDKQTTLGTERKPEHFVGTLGCDLLFSFKGLSISLSQRFNSSALKNYGGHTYGNITLNKKL